jgi:hypothetical protein
VKVVWGIGVGAGTYLALAWLQGSVAPRLARAHAEAR